MNTNTNLLLPLGQISNSVSGISPTMACASSALSMQALPQYKLFSLSDTLSTAIATYFLAPNRG
jgi:hypothetical protein